MRRKVYKNILFGMIFFIMTFCLIVQVKTINKSGTLVLDSYGNDELIDEIFKWKSRFESTNRKVEQQNTTIQEYGASLSSTGNTQEVLDKELQQAEILLGKKALRGTGITIFLNDSPLEPTEWLKLSDLIVHDMDILELVNELKLAGAEAISVNNQRIVSTSEIKCVGPVVRINGQKVAAPYIIKAIGNSDDIYQTMNEKDSKANYLRQRTIQVVITKDNEVVVPAYNQEIKVNYLTSQ